MVAFGSYGSAGRAQASIAGSCAGSWRALLWLALLSASPPTFLTGPERLLLPLILPSAQGCDWWLELLVEA